MLNIFGIQLSTIIRYSSLYLGLIYVYDNPRFNRIITTVIMELHRVKNNISMTYEDMVDYLEENNVYEKILKLSPFKIIDAHDEKREITYIGFTDFDDSIELYIDETDTHKDLDRRSVMLLGMHEYYNNERYYKRIEDCRGELFESKFIFPSDIKEKVFLQVEVDMGDDKIEIHRELKNFMVDNNILFDKPFMQWFMEHHYNIKYKDSFKINIIDKNIKIFTLQSEQVVKIKYENNKFEYIILNSEEFKAIQEERKQKDQEEAVADALAEAAREAADAMAKAAESSDHSGNKTTVEQDESSDDESSDDESGDDESGDDESGDDESGDDESGDDESGDDAKKNN